ncbi:MAG TPA: carboxymuconolactone decarboxylase, partial [Dysgonomonas sp.]|nr:carboxymuconolactone decarboxylase [Dysgonomonas sp.]
MKKIISIIFLCGMINNVNAQDMETKNNILSPRQEKIVTISAFAATGNLDKLKTELDAGLDAGLTVNEIKEVIAHLYAYCGFPRSLQANGTFAAQRQEQIGRA